MDTDTVRCQAENIFFNCLFHGQNDKADFGPPMASLVKTDLKW